MSEQLDIDAIETRAAAAVPGPWSAACGDVTNGDGEYLFVIMDTAEPTEDFIAAARTDVPALCAEVRRLREAVLEAEGASILNRNAINNLSVENGKLTEAVAERDAQLCAWQAAAAVISAKIGVEKSPESVDEFLAAVLAHLRR